MSDSFKPTKIAEPTLLNKLQELAKYFHFYDRVNTNASLQNLDLGLIQAYLQEIKSHLYAQTTKMSIEELCLSLEIARGAKENIRPLNIGLLLFSKEPEKYFSGCRTNLVEFDDEAGTSYTDKQFKGPIHLQIRKIMDYLNSNLIKDFTRKNGKVLEAQKFTNYPYQALEEAIVNALYHRSYENPMPNEIRIYKKGEDSRRIEILSYPSPLPPINKEALLQLEVTARTYRNIRLGDFLKNLRLAEKYATEIPTIIETLRANGSPRPILSTDEDSTYFLVTIKIHADTPIESSFSTVQVDSIILSNNQQLILEYLIKEPSTEEDIQNKFVSIDVATEIQFFDEKGLIGKKNIGGIQLLFITQKGIDVLNRSF